MQFGLLKRREFVTVLGGTLMVTDLADPIVVFDCKNPGRRPGFLVLLVCGAV
jgi:hypothetical protein